MEIVAMTVGVALLTAVVVLAVRLHRTRTMAGTLVALVNHDNAALMDELAKVKADLFAARDQLDIVEAVAEKFQADAQQERDRRVRAESDGGKVVLRLLVEQDRATAAHGSALAARDAEHAQQLGALSRLLAFATLPAPALSAAPSPPELLPSGHHALIEGEPAVLLQLDGDDPADPLAGPLPAGTRGVRR